MPRHRQYQKDWRKDAVKTYLERYLETASKDNLIGIRDAKVQQIQDLQLEVFRIDVRLRQLGEPKNERESTAATAASKPPITNAKSSASDYRRGRDAI